MNTIHPFALSTRVLALAATLLCCHLPARAFAGDAPRLLADTSNPTNGMFAIGRPAEAVFRAEGWASGEERMVTAAICDYTGATVDVRRVVLRAGAEGTGEVSMSLPTERFGCFRVHAEADGGLKPSKRGTRPAGFVTYGVAAAPEDRRSVSQEEAFQGIHGGVAGQDLWIGAHQGFAQIYESEDGRRKAAESRRRSGRVPEWWGAWGVISVSPGDRLAWDAGKLSVKSQAWIRENKPKGAVDWRVFSDPEGREVYREWVASRAEKYATFPRTPGRRIYEVLWEPDVSDPKPDTVVEAARFASQCVKAADPEGLVALPTICNVSRLAWHRDLFRRGILRFADVFSLHPYTDYPPEPNGFIENFRAIKRLLAESGRPDIPIICTESGYQASATVADERVQLEGQVRAHLILLGEGVWFNMPFYGADYGGDRGDRSEGDYGLSYNLDFPNPRFGAKHISPRPVFCGISAFSLLLDGWRPRDCLDFLGGTAWGYSYTNRLGEIRVAVWDWGKTPTAQRIGVGRESVMTADIMGNPAMRPAPGGTLEVEAGTSPTYIFDPDPAAFDAWLAGRRAEANAANDRRAKMALELRDLGAAFADGEPAVRLTVANRFGNAVNAAVTTRIDGIPQTMRTTEVSLKPHEARTVSVPLPGFRPDPFQTFRLLAEATDGSGDAVESGADANFMLATFDPSAGVSTPISEWGGAPRYRVPFAPNADGGGITGPGDLSAEIGFAWNERYLLVDALVLDDAFHQDNKGWWTWNGDCIQFGFAKRKLEKLSGNDYTDSLEQGFSELDFALTRDGPEGYRTVTFDSREFPADRNGGGQLDPEECPVDIALSGREDGGVAIRYRIAIPWKFLNKRIGAFAGETVFFAAMFNDRDPGDSTFSSIKAFDLKRIPPRHFGCIHLGSE